jgi:hypothetical protein
MSKYVIVTAIHQETAGTHSLYIFSMKMRNEHGEWEPVQMWSYETFAQAKANRDKVLCAKFPAPTLRLVA